MTLRRRLLGLGALTAALLFAFQGSAQAAFLPYPGLPEPAPNLSAANWYWVQQAGMSETVKAEQYVALPPLTMASWGGTRQLPPSEPLTGRFVTIGDTAFVSPPGAPKPYGYMPPLRVRSVGFGMLPVEATMQISQRFKDGKVVPVHAEVGATTYQAHDSPNYEVQDDVVVTDAFNVQVTKVTLDGVSVGLTGDCHTVTPAPVRLVGKGYAVPRSVHDAGLDTPEWPRKTFGLANFFNPLIGGQLSGTMTIPPFTGCTTKNGDDLSPLLTLSASGPGNKVVATASACVQQSTFGLPPAPGDWDKYPFPDVGQSSNPDIAWCRPLAGDELIPYPARPTH